MSRLLTVLLVIVLAFLFRPPLEATPAEDGGLSGKRSSTTEEPNTGHESSVSAVPTARHDDDDDDEDDDDNSGPGNHDDDDDDDDNSGPGNHDDDDDDDDDNNDGGDDDAPRQGLFKFGQRSFLVSEAAGLATITVERSKGEDGAVSVSYTTRSGSAESPADYQETSGTLTWANGDGSDRSFTIPIENDGVAEDSETVELLLEAPTGGAILDSERAQAVLTILDADGGVGGGNPPPGGDDNERPGTLKFDFREFSTIENAAEVTIAVDRSRGERGVVTVRYNTLDESAVAGEDYVATSGILSWAAGDGSAKTFSVPLLDDSTLEGNETFRVELSGATGGAGIDPTRGSAPVQIIDNDAARTRCTANATTLCLLGGELAVEIRWTTKRGQSGRGQARRLSEKSGLFWFFDRDNFEMLVKAVDGCRISGSRWLYFSGTTDVGYTVRVTESATGLAREYRNVTGQLALPVADTATFRGCATR